MGTTWFSGIKRAAPGLSRSMVRVTEPPKTPGGVIDRLPMTSKPACTWCTSQEYWAGDSEVASACAWATTLCPCRKATARSTQSRAFSLWASTHTTCTSLALSSPRSLSTKQSVRLVRP